jgi:nucleotide-binding universal stress UspA family protein
MEEAVLANPPTLQARLERNLRKKVRDKLGDSSVPVVVRPFFGEPGGCIARIAEERQCQLIAIGTHQRHGIHRLAQFSVSRDVLRQARTNVLCVPVTAPFDPQEAHVPDFSRVLVATDFSELGNTAVPFACALCGVGGLVRLVHVLSPRARGTADQVAARLRALIPHETGARCQAPEVVVREGADTAVVICAEAEDFGADAVCLASHGFGLARALHGSVAKAVLQRLRLPVLVVRRPGD